MGPRLSSIYYMCDLFLLHLTGCIYILHNYDVYNAFMIHGYISIYKYHIYTYIYTYIYYSDIHTYIQCMIIVIELYENMRPTTSMSPHTLQFIFDSLGGSIRGQDPLNSGFISLHNIHIQCINDLI
jgi:hypothetical protein